MADTNRGLQIRMVAVMVMLAILGVTFATVVGYFIDSILLAIFIVTVLSILQYVYSGKIALKSMGAKRVDQNQYPDLHSMVNRTAQHANIPKPDVAVADSQMPNAFAAGRNEDKAVVTVTTGLMDQLDDDELEAVVAHEISHIKNRDVVVMTVAGVITMITGIIIRYSMYFTMGSRNKGAAAFLAIFVVSLITYVVGYLLIRALSRYREFAADKGSAEITGDPLALAEALRTIDDSMDATPDEDLRGASGTSALMISPVKSKLASVLSTHPSTERRVEKLNEIANNME